MYIPTTYEAGSADEELHVVRKPLAIAYIPTPLRVLLINKLM